jgi:hypothetical protein
MKIIEKGEEFKMISDLLLHQLAEKQVKNKEQRYVIYEVKSEVFLG